ncbi:MAG: DNA polymerase III subunit gamma/tau [Deltaproteobacteria bacterium]|nr:DNA polymerase III subunit gamma/tau [Deltaproteobacteria bacterium]
MAYLVLARKWRPQRFEDVVGQDHVTTTLRNAITQGRIAHAFLFSGPRGVGKTTIARLLARALNCERGPTAEPCGTCGSCADIAAGSALDVAEIDGASNTGVDNIRDLNEAVRYRPASGRFKIYIIDEVHMLSTAAFNALLKTLEEPPEHVKFIFATTEVNRLPPTVVSRCQRYEFKRIPMPELLARLKQIAADEKIETSDAALFALAREADGSMRDAQSLLDQVIVFAGKTIGEAEVRAALGVADRSVLHRTTEAILARDPATCLQAVEELHRYGYEVGQFCRDLVRQLRNLTVAALFADAGMLTDLPDAEVEETMRQATLRSSDDLQRLFRMAQVGADEIRRSILPAVMLEMTLVKMATMPDAAPLDQLLARLEAMERRLGGGAPGGGPRPASGAPAAAPSPARPPAPGAGPSPRADAASAASPPRPAPPPRPPSAAAAPPAADPAGNGGKGWDGFLAAAQSKISLKVYLAGSRLLEETGDTLHIGVENDLAMRALKDPDSAAALQEIAFRAYGGARRILVSVAKPPAEEIAMRMAAEDARRREISERAERSTSVRAAVDILGGEITEVRPRGRGGKT